MTDGPHEAARRRLDAGMPPQAVARNLGVSVPTRYRRLPAGSGKMERCDAGGQPAGDSSGFTCAGKRRCGEMTSCEEARFYPDRVRSPSLDGDKDGVLREKLCR